jgi:hypothetical protein
MTTDQQPDTFSFLGVTDECVECQRCGKPGLKSTVVLAVLDHDGNDGDITYFGSSCAARALGWSGRGVARTVLGKAQAAHRATLSAAYDARQMLASYGLPETGEADEDTIRAAVRLYNRRNWNTADLVARTGKNIRQHVSEMLGRYQGAISDARRLGVPVPSTQAELDRAIWG